jgi:hypothetical protein
MIVSRVSRDRFAVLRAVRNAKKFREFCTKGLDVKIRIVKIDQHTGAMLLGSLRLTSINIDQH